MVITAQEVATLRKQTGLGMMDCKQALTEAAGDFEKAIELLRKKGKKLSQARAHCATTEGAVFVDVDANHQKAVLIALCCETDFVTKSTDFQKLGKSILAAACTHRPASLAELLALPGQDVQEAITACMGRVGENIILHTYETLSSDVVASYVHHGQKLGVLVGLQGASGPHIAEAGSNVAMHVAAMQPMAVRKEEIDGSLIQRELLLAQEQARNEGRPAAIVEKIAQGKLAKFLQEHTLLEQPFVKNNALTVAQYIHSIAPGVTVTAFKRIAIGT